MHGLYTVDLLNMELSWTATDHNLTLSPSPLDIVISSVDVIVADPETTPSRAGSLSPVGLGLPDHTCNGSESYWPSKWVTFRELYFYPLVIIIGIVFHFLSLVVLLTRSYRGTSTGFLLTVLSLADLGVLTTGILRAWLLALSESHLDLRTLSPFGCKSHMFFTYLFQYVSCWTIALITVERAVSVRHPLSCKIYCSLRNVVLAWLLVVLLSVMINVHFFWTYTLLLDPRTSTYKCHGLVEHYAFLYYGAHNWLDLVFACLAPFTVIITCNVTIVCRLTSAANAPTVPLNANNRVTTSRQTSSTTVMLLCVSVVFLVLVAPFTIFSLGESYHVWPQHSPLDCSKLDLAYSIVYLMYNVNSAINFLLYWTSGKRFRNDLRQLLCATGRRISNTIMPSRLEGDNQPGSPNQVTCSPGVTLQCARTPVLARITQPTLILPQKSPQSNHRIIQPHPKPPNYLEDAVIRFIDDDSSASANL